MAEEVREQSTQFDEVLPYGDIIESGISADEYMQKYRGERVEWVRGYVIKIRSLTLQNAQLKGFLFLLFSAYFSLNRNGKVIKGMFAMRMDSVKSMREPDLLVVLGDGVERIRETFLDGAADICIEIVSEESVARDYSEKLAEYRQGGVKEYWIIDPLQQQTIFWRLGDDGQYVSQKLDPDGNYSTPLLPKLKLHVPTLWLDELPDIDEMFPAMQQILKESRDV